jgi:hypothetical protein
MRPQTSMNSDIESATEIGPGRAPRSATRWLREPLLHFLVIGAALFVLFRVMNSGDTGAPREIVISEARVQALAENFARTWMRPPTRDELRGLVNDYVAEEVYYREAIAMGLDRDDTVIRRRLRQKMEFISEDVAAAAEPTDADLQAYLDAHEEKFLEPPRLSFEQVYLSSERRGEATRRDAENVLAELRAGRGREEPQQMGDPTLLPPALREASPQEIMNTFGSEFAQQVEEAPVGQWSGPLQSGFGLHVVRVDAREPGRLPTLDEIRPIVVREWQAENRRTSNEALLATLRGKYDVRVEGEFARLLDEPGGARTAAAGGSAGQAGGRPAADAGGSTGGGG